MFPIWDIGKNGLLLVEKMHSSRSALLTVFFRLLAIEMPERISPLCRLVGPCTIIGKKAHRTGINFPLNLKVCWNRYLHPPFDPEMWKNLSYLLLLFCYKMKSKRNTELETSALNWAILQWLRKSVSGIEKDSRQFFEMNDFVSQTWRKRSMATLQSYIA